jgi:hypothetical protein
MQDVPSTSQVSPSAPCVSACGGGVVLRKSRQILSQITRLFDSTEQANNVLCLHVTGWETGNPAVIIAVDGDTSLKPDEVLADMLRPHGQLEFRVKVPEGSLGGRGGFHGLLQGFLQGNCTLGIKIIYSEKHAQKHLKSLKKSNRKRLKWSNTIEAAGFRISWVHDISSPHLIIVRLYRDDERLVAVVDKTHGFYKTELKSDIVSGRSQFACGSLMNDSTVLLTQLCSRFGFCSESCGGGAYLKSFRLEYLCLLIVSKTLPRDPKISGGGPWFWHSEKRSKAHERLKITSQDRTMVSLMRQRH